MILSRFVPEPFDLSPSLYFAMLSRLNYVQRMVNNQGFTREELATIGFYRDLEEDW